jgi:Skp family chaperone for outer membrane proteins
MLKSLLAKADATIKVLAEQEGFDFVVQEAVYIKPEYDLTVRVLEKMR